MALRRFGGVEHEIGEDLVHQQGMRPQHQVFVAVDPQVAAAQHQVRPYQIERVANFAQQRNLLNLALATLPYGVGQPAIQHDQAFGGSSQTLHLGVRAEHAPQFLEIHDDGHQHVVGIVRGGRCEQAGEHTTFAGEDGGGATADFGMRALEAREHRPGAAKHPEGGDDDEQDAL